MKWNGTRLTAGCRHEQGGMGMKIMTALILALAMVLAMLCATAEDSYAGLTLGESVQASDEAITIEDEAAGEDGMDIELADEAILDEDTLVVDELSLDGLENNLLSDGLVELESIAEDNSNALAGNESNPEDFEIDEDGVLVKYKGKGGDVVIPDGVTAIGKYAFDSCSKLTSLTIPDSVTSIGKGAFRYCSSLTSVTIPDSVTSIGDSVFRSCSKLTSVAIPNSVTSIGKGAFGWCWSLTTVTIPNSVTSIGNSAFAYCSKLTTVTIPDSVTSIGEGAFYDCDNLTSVTIPDSVTNIGTSAFSSCDSLDKITVSADNPAYISENGILYSRDMSTLLCCPGAKTSVTIPNSVTNIKNSAFSGCESLTSVTIPDSVTRIGEDAFFYCTSLTSVTIPSSVTSIGFEAFRQCYNLTTVTIPDSVTRIGKDAFYDCDNLTIYGENGSYAEAYAKKNGIKISALSEPISLAKARLTVKDQVYNGKALKPAITVKYGSKTLKKGTDYTVSYKNNKAIGTATVTVTGKGDYTGTAKKTFKINPKAVSGLKLTAGKGRLTVSWKKGAGGIGGYQLQYGLKKSFSGAKKVNVAKASTLKRTLKKLKKGKIYYVRIRAFKKVGKTTYWSAWSSAKKAKVK